VDTGTPIAVNTSLADIAAMDLPDVLAKANPVLRATLEQLYSTDVQQTLGGFGSSIETDW
jgi:hypothetical protein